MFRGTVCTFLLARLEPGLSIIPLAIRQWFHALSAPIHTADAMPKRQFCRVGLPVRIWYYVKLYSLRIGLPVSVKRNPTTLCILRIVQYRYFCVLTMFYPVA